MQCRDLGEEVYIWKRKTCVKSCRFTQQAVPHVIEMLPSKESMVVN